MYERQEVTHIVSLLEKVVVVLEAWEKRETGRPEDDGREEDAINLLRGNIELTVEQMIACLAECWHHTFPAVTPCKTNTTSRHRHLRT